jgi:Uncharacterised nucleotidyltransferase
MALRRVSARRSPPHPESLPRVATYRVLQPLPLLCRWLAAAHQGRELDAAAIAALLDPAAELVGLARLAGRHYVTPMLAACIADPELRQRLPEDFALYLDFVHTENSRRNHALRVQLRETAGCLNEIGIEPVVLKGAIRLVDGLYPDLGWRFMRDLDLLVPRDRRFDVVARLASIGYSFTLEPAELPVQHRHLPPLGRDSDGAVVEIHTELVPARPVFCDAENVLARSRLVDLDGARVRLPQAVDQLAHLIGHDRFDGHLHLSGTFLLRSVFETALLCRDENAVGQLLARGAAAGLARWAGVQLGLAARLFPEYVARPSGGDLLERLQVQALMAMERFDENGRLRLFVWFGLRLGQVLMSSTERGRVASNMRSPDYRRRSVERLRSRWTSH